MTTIEVSEKDYPGCNMYQVRVPYNPNFVAKLKQLSKEDVGVNQAIWDKGLGAWLVPLPQRKVLWAALKSEFPGATLITERGEFKIQ